MNIDKQRKLECLNACCKDIFKCLVYHGQDCARLGGYKIPVERQSQPKVKSKFLFTDGWRVDL